MAQEGEQTVLRRKALAARAAHDARSMSPSRALRLALERCAARDLGFMLSVTGIEIVTDLADGLSQGLPDPALILLLDGPDGLPGAFIMDAQVAAALVEVQTMGRALGRPATPRAPTRTDAAIAEPMVDGVLTRFVDLLDGAGDWARGFRFGAMIADARALALALGTGDYRVMRAGCDIGPDRKGEVMLALPLIPAPSEPAEPETAVDSAAAARPLRDRLLNAPARLDAVLCRVSLPLSQVQALRPGEVLKLPPGVLSSTAIEVAPGRIVARATLGQMSGQRALRLRAALPRHSLSALPGDDRDDGADAADLPVSDGPRAAPAPPGPGPLPDPTPVQIDPAEGLPDLTDFAMPMEGAFGEGAEDPADMPSFPIAGDLDG